MHSSVRGRSPSPSNSTASSTLATPTLPPPPQRTFLDPSSQAQTDLSKYTDKAKDNFAMNLTTYSARSSSRTILLHSSSTPYRALVIPLNN